MDDRATGLVYVFTGDGKGKTSAALGVAMRAVGQGKRVAMVQWYKERRWNIGEHKLPEILSGTRKYKKVQESTRKETGSFEIYPMGQGFYKLPTDHATQIEHKKAAEEAMKMAKKLLENELLVVSPNNQKRFLLVLDEVLNAVNDGLIDLIDLINLISKRGETHIILTGRNAPKKLIDLADLVTEMKNVKHPFEKGKKAVLGLDF